MTDPASSIEQTDKPRSKARMILRVIFAAVAVAIVISSVQFQDYLIQVQEDQHFRIVDQSEHDFVIVNAAGDQITVPKPADELGYKYQPGAISLARSMERRSTIMGILIFAGVPMCLALRWWVLVRVQDIHKPYSLMFRLTFAGWFFSFFGIGTNSGDVLKAIWLSRLTPWRTRAFVSAFVDRFLGIVSMIVTVSVLVVLMWNDPQIKHLIAPMVVLIFAVLCAVCVLFSTRLRRLARRLIKPVGDSLARIVAAILSLMPTGVWRRLKIDHLQEHVTEVGLLAGVDRLFTKVDEALYAYRRRWPALGLGILISATLQLLVSTSAYFFGQALQIDAAIWYYWFYVPIAFMIGSIPVSVFFGLGLLEAAYIGLFHGSGMATVTQAAMLAMSVRMVQLLWALPGSYVLARGLPKGAQTTQQMVTNETPAD